MLSNGPAEMASNTKEGSCQWSKYVLKSYYSTNIVYVKNVIDYWHGAMVSKPVSLDQLQQSNEFDPHRVHHNLCLVPHIRYM